MTTTRDVVRLPMQIVRYCSIVLMAFIPMSGASAQNDHAVQSPSLPPPPYQKQSLTLSFGAGIPQSRTGLTSFWEMGPSVSVKFMIHVNRALAFGLGLDVAHLRFKEHSFLSRFPGIAVRPQDITMGALSLAMKYSLLPTMRLSPFVGATVGATRLSEAVYRETVDSVRVTYYNIPGRTRLTFGLAAGLDIYVVRWLSLQLEAKTTYIHNDPDLGFASFLRGGVRLTL